LTIAVFDAESGPIRPAFRLDAEFAEKHREYKAFAVFRAFRANPQSLHQERKGREGCAKAAKIIE
jgi:hypothetical protein